MGDICLVGGAIPEISPSCLPTHVLERTVGFVMLLINRAVSLGALQTSRHTILPPVPKCWPFEFCPKSNFCSFDLRQN